MGRVPYLRREQLSPKGAETYDRIQETRGEVLNVFRALLNSEGAAQAVASLGEYLRSHSALDPQAREIAILMTARETGSHYEWAQHEPVAREVGVPEPVIEAVRTGRAPMGIPAKLGIFAQAAKELVNDGVLRDRTYQAVEHLLGPRLTVDLVVLVSYYTMLSRIIAGLEVEIEEGLEGGTPAT